MNKTNYELNDPPSPYWIASAPGTDYPELDKDFSVDVAIVGGGIVGITTAYLLTKSGLKVAIIEADRILQGTTGHSTAKITSQHSLIYARLKKEMGKELAKQYADANESAIHKIASIVEEKNIDCDFAWRPAYVYTQSNKYVKKIEDEVDAAASLGIKASYLEDIPLPFSIQSAVRFDEQAQFHPVKYLLALAADVKNSGSYIFENTEAVDIADGEPCTVTTRTGKKVTASKVIIASHFPFFDGGGLYFARMYAEKSYIIGLKAQDRFPEGMFITAEDPGRSLRSQNYDNGELILIAGEHHRTGENENTNIHYQNLISFAKDTFQVEDIIYRWSTQDCMTMDGVPYIGNLTSRSPNLYVATGFGKWGISNGTVAGMLLTDLITKGDSPWAPVYNPSRFSSAASIVNFIVQNATVAKHFIGGKLAAPENAEIEKGEARIIEAEGKKVGAFRDEQGQLHMVDTTCTHMGCELTWNDAERTWDCPCHGSRFTYEGDIVEGPATNRLHHTQGDPNIVEPNVFK